MITAAPRIPAELVGAVPLTEDVSVGEYQRLAHAAIDEAASCRSSSGAPACTFARRCRRSSCRRRPRRVGASTGSASTTGSAPRPHTRCSASSTRPPLRASTRTTASVVVRALELAEAGSSLAPGTDRLWTDDVRVPTLIVALDLPPAELDRRIDARAAAMAEAGAAAEARAAWDRPLSATARKVLGLEQFATLPETEAVEAVAHATRRLARYQRKWLRRMPGVTTLDGRPACGGGRR